MTNHNSPSLIEFVSKALSGTPIWVWCILGYLLFVGLKATQERTVFLPRLFIIPLVLTGMKYNHFMNFTPQMGIFFGLGLVAAAWLGGKWGARDKISRAKGTLCLKVQGEYGTLVLLLSFFCVRYVFGYLKATQPGHAAQWILYELLVTGLFSGFFLGRALNYWQRYKGQKAL